MAETAKVRRVRRMMAGRLPEPNEECWVCHRPYSEKPGKGCGAAFKLFHTCHKVHVRATSPCTLRVGECFLEGAGEKARRLQVKIDAFPLDAEKVIRGVRKLHQHRNGWQTFEEFQLLTRRVDLLAVRLYNSGPPLVIYEVKVSRSDWAAELRNPEKRIEAEETAAACYFAAPAGLISREEVPRGWGLVEVSAGPRGATHPMVVVAAPERPVTQLPTLYTARMIWRMREAS